MIGEKNCHEKGVSGKSARGKPGQKVRGINIAREVDDALRYAVKGLPSVIVLTYQVDFKLSAFKK